MTTSITTVMQVNSSKFFKIRISKSLSFDSSESRQAQALINCFNIVEESMPHGTQSIIKINGAGIALAFDKLIRAFQAREPY